SSAASTASMKIWGISSRGTDTRSSSPESLAIALSALQPSVTSAAHTKVDWSSGSASGTSTWASTKPAPAMLPTNRSAPRNRLRRKRQRRLRRLGAGLAVVFRDGLGVAGGAMGEARGRASTDGTALERPFPPRWCAHQQDREGHGHRHGEGGPVPVEVDIG